MSGQFLHSPKVYILLDEYLEGAASDLIGPQLGSQLSQFRIVFHGFSEFTRWSTSANTSAATPPEIEVCYPSFSLFVHGHLNLQ